MKNIISISDISQNEILDIFNMADTNIFETYYDFFRNKILATLFFQSSTRTQLGFQSAFYKLGGQCIGFSNINESRALVYETMYDTGKVISEYADIIVMRTTNENEIYELLDGVDRPLISAGHGTIEHPTQTIIDLYTIYRLKGHLDNLNILISGNIERRTIQSLIKGLTKWNNNNIFIICPTELVIQDYSNYNQIFDTFIFFTSYEDIDSNLLKKIDVLYQDEFYLSTDTPSEGHHHYQKLFLTKERVVNFFNEQTCILHALPRMKTIDRAIDTLPNAKYFQQVSNGLYIRASILIWIFKLNNVKS